MILNFAKCENMYLAETVFWILTFFSQSNDMKSDPLLSTVSVCKFQPSTESQGSARDAPLCVVSLSYNVW